MIPNLIFGTVMWKPRKSKIWNISKGAFLWDDPDQDQWSEITRIMVDQMNRWILVQSGFIGSFDLPWSEWSRITDADPDHPKGTHHKTILDSRFHAMDSSPETVFRILCQWNLDYGFQSLVGFRIPWAVYSGIQCPGFRIPPVKISRIPLHRARTWRGLEEWMLDQRDSEIL